MTAHKGGAMMDTMTDYQKQGADFLAETDTKMTVRYVDHAEYFPADKEARDIYRITFKRNGKQFSVRFGQSIAASDADEKPTAYDVLACLTKSDPGSFEDFCGDMGYDTDSRKAEKTYKAVVREWQKVSGFWTETELLKLAEIA